MDVKRTLKAITLELRRELEGKYDQQGNWQPGDLERRLASIGVRRERAPVPVGGLPHLPPEDLEARGAVDAFIQSHTEAGQTRGEAVAEFVRGSAYTWANRLLALRCMEARGLIDEIILQKEAYGGRSLQHNRLSKKEPQRCAGEDEGLFALVFDEFARRAVELTLLFDPRVPEVALRPSVAALKRCVGLLSGTTVVKGQEPATDGIFVAPDALGWTYQYWNAEEKDRVFDKVRTKKGSKIEGADIIPATCIYTEPYMVKFLVQNSLGAMWIGMHTGSRLLEAWEYYVRDADRAPVNSRPVTSLTFIDPACGSGHFLIEAFELFYGMYVEEGSITDPAQICAAILERNLYGVDIDERAVQIAALSLVMKAKEKAPDFAPRRVNLVSTNIRLSAKKEHLDAFLAKHPEHAPLKSALSAIFAGLANAPELGSLLQIAEVVDREVRGLRSEQLQSERRASAGTLFGPRTDADWATVKQDLIARLREHFAMEANAADLSTALFGGAAEKGLTLVDVLLGRYDVVAANPPYMGSRYMGPLLKKFVQKHFSSGKRDLYAAFIMRASELAAFGGTVAMVTMNKWLHARAFAPLRCGRQLSASGVEKGERSASSLLWHRTISVLADLGSRAFDPDNKFHDGVQVALFVMANAHPDEGANIAVGDFCAAEGPLEKDRLLRAAVQAKRFRALLQHGFSSLPGAPVCYRLPSSLLAVLRGSPPFGELARVRQGICTTSDPRFVRMIWEIPPLSQARRWFHFAKGGGHRRWDGLRHFAVEWEHDGTRIKQFITDTPHAIHWSGRMPEQDYYFKRGWSFSRIAYGNLGVRFFRASDLFGHTNPLILFNPSRPPAEMIATAGLLNSPLVTFVLRAITQSNDFPEGYLRRLPFPPADHEVLESAECAARHALEHARALVEGDPREATFCGGELAALCPSGLRAGAAALKQAQLRHQFIVAVSERLLQLASYQQWGLSSPDATDFDRILGGAALPGTDSGLPAELWDRVKQWSGRDSRRDRASNDSDAELIQSATMFMRREEKEPEPFEVSEEALGDAETVQEADEEDDVVPEHQLPPFGLVDGFAKSHNVDLARAYNSLVGSVESHGVDPRTLVDVTMDFLSMYVLRLLGHRWPLEIEAESQLVKWADKDGIVPLTEGTVEPTALALVRERIANDFGAGSAHAVERECQDILGKGIGEWLALDFFKREMSQFKKRPVVWQVQSDPTIGGGRMGSRGPRKVPAFSCLVSYLFINADLLPKVRSQYLGPLRASFQTELASLEKLPKRSGDQDARRLELEHKLEELKVFDARIEQMISEGFSSSALDGIGAEEALDKWTSRDWQTAAPSTRAAFLAQERRYDPDPNDGVRVNIAPFQRARLLSADVLAAKDVEKAIAERAEWRADERRWCREGKLPQPGWWPLKERTSS